MKYNIIIPKQVEIDEDIVDVVKTTIAKNRKVYGNLVVKIGLQEFVKIYGGVCAKCEGTTNDKKILCKCCTSGYENVFIRKDDYFITMENYLKSKQKQ